jgi:hypothetical protein
MLHPGIFEKAIKDFSTRKGGGPIKYNKTQDLVGG